MQCQNGCKPKTICEDKGIEFCNRSMKSRLRDNYKQMFSTRNKENDVSERFCKNLKE